VNGLFLGLGPIGISVDELLRSFPSVYQLLPTYPCLDVGDGELRKISGLDLPNTSVINIEEGLAFHAKIGASVENVPRYQSFVVKGVDQPTGQSAILRERKIESLRSYKGEDKGGDGTVPRPSSHPPEWEDERASTFVSQKHAVLQSTDSLLTQVAGMLTGHLGRFMGGARIGVDIPDVLEVGRSLLVKATSKDGDATLPLHVVCESEHSLEFGRPRLMRSSGDGRYHARIEGLPEGAWRVTVQSATPARPVEPVSDWVLILRSDVI
jgi:hypothetical protein